MQFLSSFSVSPYIYIIDLFNGGGCEDCIGLKWLFGLFTDGALRAVGI